MGKSPEVSTEIPTTTANLDIFGSATTGPNGTSVKLSDFQKGFTGLNESAALNAAREYFNPNYDSEAYRAGDAYYTNKLNTALQNNYLNPALSRGLLRGSTASDIMRGFGQDLANTEYERQRQYKQDQANMLSTALNGYNNMYNIASGLASLSNSTNAPIAQYKQAGERANQQAEIAQQQAIANMIGQGIGAAGKLGAAFATGGTSLLGNTLGTAALGGGSSLANALAAQTSVPGLNKILNMPSIMSY